MIKSDHSLDSLLESAAQIRAMDVALYRLGENIEETNSEPATELLNFFISNNIGEKLSSIYRNIFSYLDQIHQDNEELRDRLDKMIKSRLKSYKIHKY